MEEKVIEKVQMQEMAFFSAAKKGYIASILNKHMS